MTAHTQEKQDPFCDVTKRGSFGRQCFSSAFSSCLRAFVPSCEKQNAWFANWTWKNPFPRFSHEGIEFFRKFQADWHWHGCCFSHEGTKARRHEEEKAGEQSLRSPFVISSWGGHRKKPSACNCGEFAVIKNQAELNISSRFQSPDWERDWGRNSVSRGGKESEIPGQLALRIWRFVTRKNERTVP